MDNHDTAATAGHDEDQPSIHELDVLWALRVWGTVPKAAKKLVLSRFTVQTHIGNLRRKTGLHYVVQIVGWAYDNGCFTKAGVVR